MYIDFSMVQEYLHQYGPGPLAEWRRQVAQHDMSNARYKQVFNLIFILDIALSFRNYFP